MSDQTFDVLRKIEAVSMSLEIRGRWIVEDANQLVNIPDWETNAEDHLVKAETQLIRTLQAIQQAKELLARKKPQQERRSA